MNYKAFMSYSHAADGKLAPSLQSALQAFAKQWYKLRAIRIFRDKTTLAMTPGLWPSIQAALDESEYFLLLASVESAQSPWVEREVEYWLERRGLDSLLIIVTGSSPLSAEDASLDFSWIRTNLLPPVLRNRTTEEPLYLDLRWVKTEEQLSERHPRFLDEIAGLCSTLTGKPKDILTGEDVKQHRRLRHLAWSAAILLILLTTASLAGAVFSTWQRDLARARELVSASMLSESTDPELSVLIAGESVATTWRWGHTVLQESEQRLHDAMLASHLRMTLSGHNKAVDAIAWSPDGKQLATAGRDKTVKLWRVDTGKVVWTFRGHTDSVDGLAWSPDGKRLATASEGGAVKLLDIGTGKEVLSFHTGDTISGIAWSPDGQRLAAVADEIGTTVWDAVAGKQLFSIEGGDTSLAWSPDGKWLAIASSFDAVKFDARTGKPVKIFTGHTEAVNSVAWSPDSKRLATASLDKTAMVWDTETGKGLLTLDGHAGGLTSISWSPDGKQLATASADSTAKVWNAVTGKQILTLSGHELGLTSTAWSPDGEHLATASEDATAKVWDARPVERLLISSSGDLRNVSWSPDGKVLAISRAYQNAQLWDFASGRDAMTLSCKGNVDYSVVAWSPDGQRLATMCREGTLVLDAPSGNALLTLKAWPMDLSWRPDGKRLATADGQGNAELWDTTSGRNVLRLKDPGTLSSVVWKADGKRFATTNLGNRAVNVWDGTTGQHLLTLRAGTNSMSSAAWSPDGTQVATCETTAVRLWNESNGREIRTLTSDRHYPQSLAWSPDGKRLATGGDDHTTKVWDSATGREVLTLVGHNDKVTSVAWSADGKWLASAGADGVVQVYATDIRDLMKLARERVSAHLSDQGCQRFLHVVRCPVFPDL